MKRINKNAAFSGIIRFLDFDFRTGKCKVLVSTLAHAPTGEIHEISYDYFGKLITLIGRPGLGKAISGNAAVIDRYLVKEIQDLF